MAEVKSTSGEGEWYNVDAELKTGNENWKIGYRTKNLTYIHVFGACIFFRCTVLQYNVVNFNRVE